MSDLLQQILEQKRLRRRELAALPFPEKVKVVLRMRGALSSIAASRAGMARRDPQLSSDLVKTSERPR
jgi:hypothetical protein